VIDVRYAGRVNEQAPGPRILNPSLMNGERFDPCRAIVVGLVVMCLWPAAAGGEAAPPTPAPAPGGAPAPSAGAAVPPPGTAPAHETFYSVQNTLTIPLPIGARPRLAVQQAQAELEAARAQYDGARLTLAQDVGTAYYDLLRRQALLQIAQETLATAQRQLEETQRRLTAGDVAPLDVTRA